MKTLVATISVGPREQLRKFSFPRLKNWGEKHGYTVVLIDRPLQDGGRTPHYAKLRVPQAFPDFDRYCIVDDDLLISSVAPALPDIPAGKVGLVPDAEQRNTTRRDVKWTGNTGFILLR